MSLKFIFLMITEFLSFSLSVYLYRLCTVYSFILITLVLLIVESTNTFFFLFLFLQKRQGQGNSQSRSEKFNPHPEEVASGFPIDPPRPSQAAGVSVDPQVHQHKRASHSGPLTHRAAWAKAGKNQDDAPKISMGGDLSTISGLVAARRSMLSDNRRERSGSSQAEAPKLISRFPGSFKETSESMMQQDQKHHAHASQKEEGRGCNKDSNLVSNCTLSRCPTFSMLICTAWFGLKPSRMALCNSCS